MRSQLICLSASLALAAVAQGAVTDLPTDRELTSLVALYQSLHAAPELSHHEERTAALVATELRKAGYTVTERIGRYPDGFQAYGVVAILENGPGPRLLLDVGDWCRGLAAASIKDLKLPKQLISLVGAVAQRRAPPLAVHGLLHVLARTGVIPSSSKYSWSRKWGIAEVSPVANGTFS